MKVYLPIDMSEYISSKDWIKFSKLLEKIGKVKKRDLQGCYKQKKCGRIK